MILDACLPGPIGAVRLRSADGQIADRVTERFGSVLQEPTSEPVLDLELVPAQIPGATFDDGFAGRLDGDRLYVELSGARGSLDLRTGSGRFDIATAFRRFDLYVENLLRMTMVEHAARNGWLLAHSGCVATDEDRAWMFLGPSGAGKSTVTTSAARAGLRPVSDDLVFVQPTSRAVYSALFHRNAALLDVSPGPFELGAMFVLRQAPTTRLVPISTAAAAAELSASLVSWRKRSRTELENVLDAAAVLATAVPVMELHFTPDARVWEPIRHELYRL